MDGTWNLRCCRCISLFILYAAWQSSFLVLHHHIRTRLAVDVTIHRLSGSLLLHIEPSPGGVNNEGIARPLITGKLHDVCIRMDTVHRQELIGRNREGLFYT